jgi:hypothetical protein
MVDNSTSPLQTHFELVFRQWAVRTGHLILERGSIRFFCWHLHRPPHDMTLQPHLASVALKRKPAARGKRAPRAPSIVGWFCRLPELPYAVDSVAPDVCHLFLEAARALPGARHGDAQNDRKLATIASEPGAVRPVGKWPRFDGPALPRHDGQ